jgi:gas vesicle protein
MSNDNGNMFLALLTGAAIGVGIGILYAPDKGIETRHKIKQKAIDTKNEVADTISRITEELSRTAETKKMDFEKKLEKTISNMSYKADDIIVALENKLEELRKKNAQLQK